MVQFVGTLTWQETAAAASPLAPYSVNFGTDPVWNFGLFGSYQNKPLFPRGISIDNSANKASVIVTYGPFATSIDPFSKVNIPLPNETMFVKLQCTAAQTAIATFYMDAGAMGQTISNNQYAISATVQAAIAAATLGTMNPVINSSFAVSTPTLVSVAGANYFAEGWVLSSAAGQVTTGQTGGPLLTSQTGLKVQRNAGSALVQQIAVGTSLQSKDSAQFVGFPIALSVDLAFGADFASQGPLTVSVFIGVGQDQNVFSFTGSLTVATATFNYTGAPARVTVQGNTPVPNNATQIGIVVSYNPVGTAGANESFVVSRFQLDGQSPQSFRPVPISYERARCLTFFEVINEELTAGNYVFSVGYMGDTVNFLGMIHYVPKRIANPIITLTGAHRIDGNGVSGYAASPSYSQARLQLTSVTPLTAGLGAQWYGQAAQTSTVQINARM